jgi:hypothetical protein
MPTLLRHRNRQPRLGHGIHRSRHQRRIQRDRCACQLRLRAHLRAEQHRCKPGTRRTSSKVRASGKADARAKLTALDVDFGHLILKKSLFGGKNLKVAGDAAFVALVGEIDGVLRGIDSALLDGGFLFQNAQRSELVFDVVEGLEDRVAIAVCLRLIGMARLIGERVALAGVERAAPRPGRPVSTLCSGPESTCRDCVL